MRGRRIYIAGPMTGMERFNRPRFEEAARTLRGRGWSVESPVEIGDAFGSEEELVNTPGLLDRVIDMELWALGMCDAIYLLEGWEKSRGAKRELWLALEKGLEVIVEARAEGPRRQDAADATRTPTGSRQDADTAEADRKDKPT